MVYAIKKMLKFVIIGDITINAYKFSEFKDKLLSFLNTNPLITYNLFKKHAFKYYLDNNFKFSIKKNTFNNIYYEWRKTSKIFNWYSIFDNTLTIDRGNYLKDVVTSLLYTSN